MTGRRGQLVAVAAMVLMALGGCGLPVRADARLADGWSMPSAGKQVEPLAGDCHGGGTAEQVNVVTEETMDCAFSHLRETTYVGTFTGVAAQLDHPPRLLSGLERDMAVQAEAYAECDRQTATYLGRASWYDIRLRLEIVVPTDAAWEAGRRWFRCDLVHIDLNWGFSDFVEGSLKRFPYDAACLDVTRDARNVVDCAAGHNAEYVGSFLSPMVAKEPTTDADYEPLQARCRTLAAAYLGVAANRVQQVTGTTLWFDYEYKFWPAGRRIVHCALWFDQKTMTGSAKGKRGTNLPK